MKVIDLVLLGRYPYFQNQKATTRDVAIAYETLDLMGLAQKAEQNVLELSGGEQQRVQIARVLSQVWDSSAKHPKVLLLDEPTSNLDIAYQHSLLQLLREKAKKQGLSILIILHDMNLAARYVDQIILLKNGQQRIVGPPEETLTEYWIKDAFGVSSVIQNHPVFNCIQVSTY